MIPPSFQDVFSLFSTAGAMYNIYLLFSSDLHFGYCFRQFSLYRILNGFRLREITLLFIAFLIEEYICHW